MKLNIEVDDTTIEFECEDTLASAWVSRGILEGGTYPYLPFVDDVRVILDAGANCGAATTHFARHYPGAEVHSFEPGRRQRAYLERNTAGLAHVHIHPIGLHSQDQEVPLYAGKGDSGMSSIVPGPWTEEVHEIITVRAAGEWAAENGIDRIDILKLDVEGCEVEVLSSLAPLIPTMQVVYVEYDSRHARREIDALLDPTHHLYVGKVLLDQGEVVYLSDQLASRPEATAHLRSVFAAGGDS